MIRILVLLVLLLPQVAFATPDFNQPTNASNWSVLLSQIRENVNQCLVSDGSGANLPNGAMRYNRSTDKFQELTAPSTWNDAPINGDGLIDYSVTVNKIAGNAIINSKMADDSVGTAEIIDSSINTVDLANNSVTAAKINVSTQVWNPTISAEETMVATLSSPSIHYYIRIGNLVCLNWKGTLNLSGRASFAFYLTLPVASNDDAMMLSNYNPPTYVYSRGATNKISISLVSGGNFALVTSVFSLNGCYAVI